MPYLSDFAALKKLMEDLFVNIISRRGALLINTPYAHFLVDVKEPGKEMCEKKVIITCTYVFNENK